METLEFNDLRMLYHSYTFENSNDYIVCSEFIEFLIGSKPERIDKLIITKNSNGKFLIKRLGRKFASGMKLIWFPNNEYISKYKQDDSLYPLMENYLNQLFDDEETIRVNVGILKTT